MGRYYRRTGLLVGVIAACAIATAILPAIDALGKLRSRHWDSKATAASAGRLYFLNAHARQVMSANTDGSDVQVVAKTAGSPDGIAVDKAAGRVYWTNMATWSPTVRFGPGSLQRADLDGSNVTTVVPSGATFRPKQMTIDFKDGKLYWSDREGMRVMRSNLDGSDVETLVETGKRVDGERGDPRNYCVGIALDVARGEMYWTQRGDRWNDNGSIWRASINIPKGESPAHRTDIQVLFDHMPEPVDLALDLKTRTMYWTSDGGEGPGADTVSRAPMDPPIDQTGGFDPAHRKDQQILVSGLDGGIGISLDLDRGRMYFTDLGGSAYSANLDGSDEKALLTGMGSITGITYVAGPAKSAGEVDAPDRSFKSKYCRIEYTVDQERDAWKLATYADSSFDRMSNDLASLDPHLMDHFDCTIVQYGTPRPGLATDAQAHTDSWDGGSRFIVSMLAQSSISPGARTLVGEPKNDDYTSMIIANELSAILLERITRHKGTGWYFHTAPQWFVQGIEGYYGDEYSSAHSREVTLPKYVAAVCSKPDEVSFANGIHVGNPYLGGVMLADFFYDTYGANRVNGLLLSHKPTFDDAFVDSFGDLGSVQHKYDAWIASQCRDRRASGQQ
jgi:hypothetical protein